MNARERDPRPVPVAFALVVFASLLACSLVAARQFHPPARSIVSLVLQHASVVAVVLVLAALARRPALRFLLFVAVVTYALAIQAHTLSMAVISLPADALLRLLTSRNDAAAVLQQAHVSRGDGVALLTLISVEVLALAVLYRRGPWRRASAAWSGGGLAVAIALMAAATGEQVLARHSDEYLRRRAVLPGYVRLFGGDLESFTFTCEGTPQAQLDAEVDRVTGSGNPRNVILIVLESFRYDVVGPRLTPHLDALAAESLVFTNAYAASTATSRVWNVLLFDRPAHTFVRDREAFEAGAASTRRGAFPARVLERAGYQVMVSMGCNFDWHGYRQRFMGEHGLVDRFYSAFPGHNRARHVADDRSTDQIVQWLGEPGLQKPFFLLTHLDSTHFYYFFHDEKAVVRPYAEGVTTRRMLSRSSAGLELLFNRYQNAVAYADFNIGRILDAVRRAGLSDDTAIVVISDHGESFEVGRFGHLQVSEVTKHVPLLMRLPGVEAARVESPTTDADVFPTLFDYLRIEGLGQGALLGRSARSAPPRRSVLTLDAVMRQAHLTFPLLTVVFDLDAVEERTLMFRPTTLFAHDGRPIAGWRDRLATLPWRSELRQVLSEGCPAS